jgi:hypothetical protein
MARTTLPARAVGVLCAIVLASVVLDPWVAGATGADDPARVAGQWDYRTRSNCGTVVGVGSVTFTWNTTTRTYDERGQVYWSDSGSRIAWWGTNVFDPQSRRLAGRMQNTLGDTVEGHWQLEGPGPDRLIVRWNQTNGCVGEGVATRPAQAP